VWRSAPAHQRPDLALAVPNSGHRGLSAVTNCVGIECQREMQHQGNAHLLFYFSPEVAFALPQFPNVDLVYQLHHRSGLFGTLGRMEEGTNANVLGIRYHL
jgi:hypothetical protein